jgi:hypothetical protein
MNQKMFKIILISLELFSRLVDIHVLFMRKTNHTLQSISYTKVKKE